MILAMAHINLRGLPAGTVGWVDPSNENIKMYLECGYLSEVPRGEQDGKTQVLLPSDSKPVSERADEGLGGVAGGALGGAEGHPGGV